MCCLFPACILRIEFLCRVVQIYYRDSENVIYAYAWDNAILNATSRRGNEQIELSIEKCRPCEAGWSCKNSQRIKCDDWSSESGVKSTECECKAGFVKENGPNTNTACGICPATSICYGKSSSAVSCVSSVANDNMSDKYCPCPAGMIRTVLPQQAPRSEAHMCTPCPINFYCPGFPNMTAVDPRQTVYAIRCPVGASSLAGSDDISDCECEDGFYVVHSYQNTEDNRMQVIAAATCQACGFGYFSNRLEGRVICPKNTQTLTNTSKNANECICENPSMYMSMQTTPARCVCRKTWLQVESNSPTSSESIVCIRCEGFPGNTTNYAGALVCACAPGYFENSTANKQMLSMSNSKMAVGDHPLSPELRTVSKMYTKLYSNSVLVSNTGDAVAAAEGSYRAGVAAVLACLLCPPNFYCLGASNPPTQAVMPMPDVLNNTHAGILQYGVLAVGATSNRWWVSCPDTGQAVVLSRGPSLYMSSCFRVVKRLTSATTQLDKLFSFTFPCILFVRTSNTSILTSIINQDKDVFNQQIFAVYAQAPHIKRVLDTAVADSGFEVREYAGFFVTLEMDVISVTQRFSPDLVQNANVLLERLAVIDQDTGAAYSTVTPLLWSCAVAQETAVALGIPIMVIPGIVKNVITERIVAKAITVIMTTLGLQCERPKYIFQLDSTQIVNTYSLFTSRNTFHFVHGNICDASYSDSTSPRQQSPYDCDLKFSGTLISSYTVTHNEQMPLTPVENTDLFSTNALHRSLDIGINTLSPSNSMTCPPNTFTKFTGAVQSVNSVRDCFTCVDAEYYDAGKRSCQLCDTGKSTCEEISPATTSEPCSWTTTLYCALLNAQVTP